MNSKHLSELTKIPISTIRYYEKIGLLPAPERGTNNYRHYTDNHVFLLEYIQFLTQLSFSLEEIKEHFHQLKHPPVNKLALLTKIEDRQAEVLQQLEQLQRVQDILTELPDALEQADDFLDKISALLH